MTKMDGWDKLESAIAAGKNEMSKMESWDNLENAVGDAMSMARITQILKDHADIDGDPDGNCDGLIDFAIADTARRIEAISDAYIRLHKEINKPDPMPERLAG